MRRSSHVFLALAGLLLLQAGGPLTPDLHAQYFGANKVQYESFDFQILRTEHFDIYHYPEERTAAQLAGRMAERWYARLSRLLNYEMTSRQPIVLYANRPHFEQTNALQGLQGEGTGGATEVFKRRVVLPFAAGLAETDHVLGHEIVHAFQFAITGEGRSVQTGGYPTALGLPLWFIEGMAEYLSVGPEDPHTAMWMRDGIQNKLPTISEMRDPYRWFPYRYGQAFWAWVGGTYGDEVVGRLLKTAGRAPDPELAMSRILGGTSKELSDRWHTAIRSAYAPMADLTRPASDYGTPIFEGDDQVTNVGPVLSPDGQRIAFLSSRGLFSIDVYIAEVETGRVIQRLTHTSVDPHFESLQFINSAGTWSPDGRTFALAAISKGKPLLAFFDVESGDKTREIRLPELGEIFNPSWSPDGRQLAFSALMGGLSDLFVYDLETEQVRRLTNDPYADLQPTWSPDGSRLAFVTDRFGADLAMLEFGGYGIAAVTIADRTVEPVAGFDTGDHTNPQWAGDGRSLFFVSTRNGVPNLYRVDVATGELRQVTNLFGGISGITPLSPAISVAPGSGRAVIASYEKESFRLYRIDDPAVLAGTPVEPPFAALNPGLLPPMERISDEVVRVLADAGTGLADTAEFSTRPYSASLGLDQVLQPSVFFAADQWGAYLGGGAGLLWSDMLGNRNLLTLLQINGGIKDITAVASYVNLRKRFNWGATVQNVPITYRFLNDIRIENVNGQPTLIEELLLFRQTNREIILSGAYPFSRAQRVEFSTSFRHLDFDQELQLRGVTQDGQAVIDSTIRLDPFDPLALGSVSAALVYDQSLFGATAPILGQRYRIEAAPVFGSLNYVGLLGDYRRYFIPVRPFTLAFRLVHFGRYAGDAEDERLRPLFIGYPGLVRGYDNNSFEGQECEPVADDPCPIFSRLLGSRMLFGNAELRFPLLGLLGLGSGYYGFFPLDFVIFGDAGMAWSRDDAYTLSGGPTAADEQAFFFGGDRRPVYSAGAGLRLNLFGAMIIEVDYSHAFQRDKWLWQFSFLPGF